LEQMMHLVKLNNQKFENQIASERAEFRKQMEAMRKEQAEANAQETVQEVVGETDETTTENDA
jgi:hypothetical protein